MEDSFSKIKRMLEEKKESFKNVLPAHINPEKFIKSILVSVQMNPKLLEADLSSFYSTCMRAAYDGLLIDGIQAAASIFKTKVQTPSGEKYITQAQYIPMLQGILKKIRNSGELASLSVNVVHDGDKFEYWVDEKGEHLNHRPMMSNPSKKMNYVYAIARTRDEDAYVEVMSHEEVLKIREASKVKNSKAWNDWFEEMAKKSVIRRLAKRLPSSTDIESSEYTEEFPAIQYKNEIPIESTKSTDSRSRVEKIIDEENKRQAK